MDSKTLIDTLASETGGSQEETIKLLEAFCRVVAESASDCNAVALPGFGSFEVRKRAERVAVHPVSGRRLLIPPKLALVFRPSAILKQKVNQDSASS